MDAATTKECIDDPQTLSDVTSCLNFLQQREVFLFKMMHDPFHKVMLYFLEHLLSQDNGPVLSIDEVLAHMNKECFTDDMKEACGGGDRDALIHFFSCHPSLFSLSEDCQHVSAVQVDFSEISAATCKAATANGNSIAEQLSTKGDNDTSIMMNHKKGIEYKKRIAKGSLGQEDCASLSSCGSHPISKQTNGGMENAASNAVGLKSSPMPRKKGASFNLKNPMQNLEKESEAVKFFQTRLLKKEERWIPIKSLAGHLSQASESIREVVGPQSDFRNFLLRHPHVFDVQGELVGLKNTFTTACIHGTGKFYSWNPSSPTAPALRSSVGNRGFKLRPKSLLISTPSTVSEAMSNAEKRKSLIAGSILSSTPLLLSDGSTNFSHTNGTGLTCSGGLLDTGGGRHGNNFMAPSCSAPSSPTASFHVSAFSVGGIPSGQHPTLTMTANDYNAVMFLRRLLEANQAGFNACPHHQSSRSESIKTNRTQIAPCMSLTDLLTQLSQLGNSSVRNTIGWTKIELEEFIRKNDIFFILRNGYVTSKKPGTISIIITGSRPVPDASRMLNNRSGRVFHVAKLWGIIDLGRHEHVFFDKSIFRHVDDLQKHFKVNEILYFNAVLAPKESRAKWRAVQVWKESDRALMERQWSAKNTPVDTSQAKVPCALVNKISLTNPPSVLENSLSSFNIPQHRQQTTRCRHEHGLGSGLTLEYTNARVKTTRRDGVKNIDTLFNAACKGGIVGVGIVGSVRQPTQLRNGEFKSHSVENSGGASLLCTTPSASTSSGVFSDDLLLDKSYNVVSGWPFSSANGNTHHQIIHFTSEDDLVTACSNVLDEDEFRNFDDTELDDVQLYEDDDERSCCSYLHDLAHDIKFISEEVEEELAQVLQLHRRFSPEDVPDIPQKREPKPRNFKEKETTENTDSTDTSSFQHSSGCNLYNFMGATRHSDVPLSFTSINTNNSNSRHEASPPIIVTQSKRDSDCTHLITQRDMSTQTLVTGDIMATQVFHERMNLA
jgi:hypothetical protein